MQDFDGEDFYWTLKRLFLTSELYVRQTSVSQTILTYLSLVFFLEEALACIAIKMQCKKKNMDVILLVILRYFQIL